MIHYRNDLRALWFGLVLSLATILLGFALGVVFGAGERPLREGLTELAQNAIAAHPDGPATTADQRVEKAWTFLRRSHLHAAAMGTTSLILIAFTPLLGAAPRTQRMIGSLLGLGSAGYALFLIVAAVRTPVMGDPLAAKESLRWLAMPSAGVYIIAVMVFTGLLIRWVFGGERVAQRRPDVVVLARNGPVRTPVSSRQPA